MMMWQNIDLIVPNQSADTMSTLPHNDCRKPSMTRQATSWDIIFNCRDGTRCTVYRQTLAKSLLVQVRPDIVTNCGTAVQHDNHTTMRCDDTALQSVAAFRPFCLPWRFDDYSPVLRNFFVAHNQNNQQICTPRIPNRNTGLVRCNSVISDK
jgi:hypothetical protein